MQYVEELGLGEEMLANAINIGEPRVIRSAVFSDDRFRPLIENSEITIEVISELLGDHRVSGMHVKSAESELIGFDNDPERLLPRDRCIVEETMAEFLLKLRDREKNSGYQYAQIVDVASASREFLTLVCSHAYLLPYLARGTLNLWVGSGSHHVNTHFDKFENLYAVVSGSKYFQLFPPDEGENLYPAKEGTSISGAMESVVNAARPDLSRYPRFELALKSMRKCDLEAGDLLYLPEGWWHNVHSVGKNIAFNIWW